MKFSSPRLQKLVLSFPRRDKNILNFIRFRGLYWFCAIFSSVLSFRDINIVKYLNMRSTVTGIYYCTLHMIVYGLLYLCNFHYFQYFVIVRAHRKLVCWLLLGVVWINNLSIYLSNIPPLCTPWLFQKWVMAAFKRKPNGWCLHCQLQPSRS